jgi:plastocyanin
MIMYFIAISSAAPVVDAQPLVGAYARFSTSRRSSRFPWHRDHLPIVEPVLQPSRLRPALLVAACVGVLAACGSNNFTREYGTSVSGVGTSGDDVGATLGAHVLSGSAGFSPQQVTIHTGEAVRWLASADGNNVVIDQYEQLDSPVLHPGDSWDVQFTRPGTYAYRSTTGTQVSGTVVVDGG